MGARLAALLLPLALASAGHVQAQMTVTARNPVRNTRTAPAATNVDLTFSQAVDAATAGNARVFSAQRGGQLVRGGNASASGNVLTVDPANNLKPGEKIFVTVPAAVTGGGGTSATKEVYQFTTATGGTGQGNFLPQATTPEVAVGNGPFTVAVGDLDNDGDLDFVTANFAQVGFASVRLNDGNGGYSGGSEVPTGSFAIATVLGDWDNDGDLDLACVNRDANTISVRFNDGAANFSGGSEVPVATNPFSVVAGDVDGDGDLDLLAPTTLGGTVSVRLNNGNGTFASSTTLTFGSNLVTLALGDLDSDGDLDLVAIRNRAAGTALVRLNNGNGISYTAAVSVAVGSLPLDLTLGDVDGDGDLDIVTANNVASGTVSLRLNNGNGTFAAGGANVPVGAFPAGVTLGDIDADGDLDLVTGNGNATGGMSVRLNDGGGTFTPPATNAELAAGAFTRVVTLGDVDADGDLDLLAANPADNALPGTVSVRLNQMAAPTIITLNPTSASVGASVTLTGTGFTGATGVSFNGTPATTFNVINATTATATVPVGATSGPVTITNPGGTSGGVSFTVASPMNVTALSPTRNARTAPAGTAVAVTFDQSVSAATAGDIRIFSAQYKGQRTATATAGGATATLTPTGGAFRPGEVVQVSVPTTVQSTGGGALAQSQVYQFTTATTGGSGTFSGGSNPGVGGAPVLVVAGDVDGDGDLDLVTANASSNTVSVRLNNGSGTFSGGSDPSVGNNPINVALGDVDGDGDLDLLTANFGGGGGNTVSVRLNNGSGTFSGGSDPGVGAGTFSVAVGDADGDGDLDLFTANASVNTASVRLNNGSGTFSGGSDVAVGSEPRIVAVADVDGDGDLDLLTVNQSGNTVSVRLNDGSGTFSGGSDPGVGASPFSVAVGDVDGDGDLDLVTANINSGTASVRLNNGSGTFSGGSDPSVAPNPHSVALGDVDGDGDLDLLTANNNASGTASVRLNNGSGIYGGGSDVAVGSAPRTVAVADVDGDGDLDLLTASQNNNTASVRLNQAADLIVSTPQTVPGGTFHNVTVTGTGTLTLTGPVTVDNTFEVQNGGQLNTNCQIISGAGDFTLAPGASLDICAAAGITTSGATGAVQVTGSRSYAADATYRYSGSGAQVTGDGLPATVRELEAANPATLQLTQAATVTNALRLSAGTLDPNGQALTLRSTATRTAYVVHAGGTTSGPVTVQRYVGGPAGLGYRHLTSPVLSATVADLAAAGFTPFVNAAYNALPTPVLPAASFPNVFGFDESRGGASPAYTDFSKGYFSPAATTAPLTSGRGYSVYMPGGRTPAFVGTPAAGNVPVTLTVAGANNSPNTLKMGWHLLGNPYAQPIDWDLATVPGGMSGSISVYRTQGGLNGQYLSRVNGLGSLPDGEVALGQAFFARATSAALFTFTDALRVESNPATVARPTTDLRPLLTLTLTGASGTEETAIYAQAGATLGEDLRFDGLRPGRNVGVPTLASLIDGQEAAVNGVPETVLTSNPETVVELTAALPQAGTYTLAVSALTNWGTTPVELFDRLTNTRYNLTTQPVVTLTATRANEEVTGRFAVVFNSQRILGTAALAASAASRLAVAPNPASGGEVRLTGAVANGPLTLLDATGRLVARATADAAGAATLSVRGLATGVYVVRAADGRATRLVVE